MLKCKGAQERVLGGRIADVSPSWLRQEAERRLVQNST